MFPAFSVGLCREGVAAGRWPTAKRPRARVRASHLTSPTISQNAFALRFIMSS